MNKDAQMRATINQKLIETGERERLKDLLRAKLIECGWKDQLKAHCKGNDAQVTSILCGQLWLWPSKGSRFRLYCLTVNLNDV
uniref:ENY2 transcription and export complex 2 subunit n=1 Tax=Meleagris gallopavo TaxID=9103 RepID=A0A803YDP8_MELGA